MKKVFTIFTLFIFIILLSSCKPNDNVLRVGMDLKYPPFETVDLSNNPEGISVDIAYALGEFFR